MPRIEVSIHEVLTDPEISIGLGTLPAGETIERKRELYGFLPSIEDVSIADDIATITFTEDSPYRADEARRTSKRGARAAERGNYQAAKEMFEEALGVMPHHAGTRRDLGMARGLKGKSALLAVETACSADKTSLRLEPTDGSLPKRKRLCPPEDDKTRLFPDNSYPSTATAWA
jgi:hypothetical protein